jgi:hypothetical protein
MYKTMEMEEAPKFQKCFNTNMKTEETQHIS